MTDGELDQVGGEIAQIGDLLEPEAGGQPEGEIPEVKTKAWSQRIPKAVAKITSVGLPNGEKKEYQEDYIEFSEGLCELFDVDENLPLVLKKLALGKAMSPEMSVVCFGLCMVGLSISLREDWQDKIATKIGKKKPKPKKTKKEEESAEEVFGIDLMHPTEEKEELNG